MGGPEPRNPFLGIGVALRVHETGSNFDVVANLRDGEPRIGSIPKQRRYLLPPHPSFEAIAVFRAVHEQPSGARKILRVAPNRRQSLRRLGDEIFKIALPASVIVAEEYELVARNSHPLCEMDGPDVRQKSRPKNPRLRQKPDDVKRERQGDTVHSKTTGADGLWGPFKADSKAFYEFVFEIPGQPITHMYRSPFARSSNLLHLRPQTLAKDEDKAGAVVYISRPRGYFGFGRDTVELGGKPAPGIPEGFATISTSKLTFAEGPQQSVPGRFNNERIPARTWPMKENRVTVIELTY